MDPTTFAFTVTGVAFYLGLRNFNLMDIMPIAYDVIFKSMVDGVLVLDNRERVVGLNQAAQSMIGHEKDEVLGKPYSLALPGQPAPEDMGPQAKEIEIAKPGANGGKRYYELSATAILNRGRSRGYLVMLHDITKQKEAEAETRQRIILEAELNERRKSESALRISESKFRNLVENAPVGIITTTPEGGILSINRAALEMFGFEAPPEPGTLNAWALYSDPGDRLRLMRSMEKNGAVTNFESLKKRRNGEVFWTAQNTIYQLTESKEKQFISIIIDNTERKKSADALARLNEELKSLNLSLETKVTERTKQLEQAAVAANASNQAKSDFLASMSHELRTPLNAILGFSQLLQAQFYGTYSTKNRPEYVNDILTSGQHLLSLINDILDLAKIEAGKMELQLFASQSEGAYGRQLTYDQRKRPTSTIFKYSRSTTPK